MVAKYLSEPNKILKSSQSIENIIATSVNITKIANNVVLDAINKINQENCHLEKTLEKYMQLQKSISV